MQLFEVGKVYDFMSLRRYFVGVSVLAMVASVVLLFFPGPKLGPDFVGGTEVEVAFPGRVTPGQIREAVSSRGFSAPEVIQVTDPKNPHRYLIRVKEVSTIAESAQRAIEQRLCYGEQRPAGCTHHASEVKFSPGGDKVSVRFEEAPDLAWIRTEVGGVSGIRLRPGQNNPVLQNARDNRVEIQLMSKGDQLMDALRAKLPTASAPKEALRMEWIGPKAGKQLRDSAIKSILITLVFIMAYVAFRFDLRFAPGGVIALAHDALVTVGVFILLGKELNLTTVAAILTIIGFSVNDTVVIYDRVRENMAKVRGASFPHLINLSTSEMLGRTILTSSTAILVLSCFFIWGTSTLKDFALAMIIGMVLGVYSSVYVALPLTDMFDRLFFAKAKKASAKA
jgi:preprotein translocase subunit SecF